MPRRTPPLLTVVYRSTAAAGMDSLDLDELLSESRVRNRATGITGMLLVQEDRFLQALEGPDADVRALMARIEADPRHEHVRVLSEEPLPARRFPDWAMAYGHVEDVAALPLQGHFDALLDVRHEQPDPLTRRERVRAWLSGRSPA